MYSPQELDEFRKKITVLSHECHIQGMKVWHGTDSKNVGGIILGKERLGTGLGGIGTYFADNIEGANDYAFKGNGHPVIMEGFLIPNKNYRIARIEIHDLLSHPDFKKGRLPSKWADNKVLQDFMHHHFDIVEITGLNRINSFGSNRALVVHNSIGEAAIKWEVLRKPIPLNRNPFNRLFPIDETHSTIFIKDYGYSKGPLQITYQPRAPVPPSMVNPSIKNVKMPLDILKLIDHGLWIYDLYKLKNHMVSAYEQDPRFLTLVKTAGEFSLEIGHDTAMAGIGSLMNISPISSILLSPFSMDSLHAPDYHRELPLPLAREGIRTALEVGIDPNYKPPSPFSYSMDPFGPVTSNYIKEKEQEIYSLYPWIIKNDGDYDWAEQTLAENEIDANENFDNQEAIDAQSNHNNEIFSPPKTDIPQPSKGMGTISCGFFVANNNFGFSVNSFDNALGTNVSVSFQTDAGAVKDYYNRLSHGDATSWKNINIHGTDYKWKLVFSGTEKCRAIVKNCKTGKELKGDDFELARHQVNHSNNQTIIELAVQKVLNRVVSKYEEETTSQLLNEYKTAITENNTQSAHHILDKLNVYDDNLNIKVFVAQQKTYLDYLKNEPNQKFLFDFIEDNPMAELTPILKESQLLKKLENEIENLKQESLQQANKTFLENLKNTVSPPSYQKDRIKVDLTFPHHFKVPSCRRDAHEIEGKVCLFDNKPLDEMNPDAISDVIKLIVDRGWLLKWSDRINDDKEFERTANIEKLKSILTSLKNLYQEVAIVSKAKNNNNLIELIGCYSSASDNFSAKGFIKNLILVQLQTQIEAGNYNEVLTFLKLLAPLNNEFNSLQIKVSNELDALNKNSELTLKQEAGTLVIKFEKQALLDKIILWTNEGEYAKAQNLVGSTFLTENQQKEISETIEKHRRTNRYITLDTVDQTLRLADNVCSLFCHKNTEPTPPSINSHPDINSFNKLLWKPSRPLVNQNKTTGFPVFKNPINELDTSVPKKFNKFKF